MIEKSVGAVIFRKEDKVKYLLLHYTEGHWGLVKGHVEKGETEEETLFRETEEETGITDLRLIEDFREEFTYSFKQDRKIINKQVTMYLAETQSKQVILSGEHMDYTWLEYEEAKEKLTFNQPKELIKKANEKIHEFSGV